jgi:hypothetical protein
MGCVSSEASREVEKERVSGKRFKIFFFPASAWAGKKGNSAVQNDTVLVFFFFKEKKCNLEEEKKFGSDSKMGYDTRLPEDAHYLSQTHSSI